MQTNHLLYVPINQIGAVCGRGGNATESSMLLAAGHTALARVFVPPASDRHTLTSVRGGH